VVVVVVVVEVVVVEVVVVDSANLAVVEVSEIEELFKPPRVKSLICDVNCWAAEDS
jgi:hypothetical protein